MQKVCVLYNNINQVKMQLQNNVEEKQDPFYLHNLAIREQKLRIYRNNRSREIMNNKEQQQNKKVQKKKIEKLNLNNRDLGDKYYLSLYLLEQKSKNWRRNNNMKDNIMKEQLRQQIGEFRLNNNRKDRFSMFFNNQKQVLKKEIIKKQKSNYLDNHKKVNQSTYSQIKINTKNSSNKQIKIIKKKLSAHQNKNNKSNSNIKIRQLVPNQSNTSRFKQYIIKSTNYKNYSRQYLSNKNDPHSSLTLQKQQNIQNVITRKNIGQFDQIMQQFTRKLQYPPDTKIFIFNSKDQYIRRILLENYWIQNINSDSKFFHLKWSVNDKNSNYSFYQGQYHNHFQNHLKLTTKIGLHQNIKKIILNHQNNYQKYYPKTFDPAYQIGAFMKQFERSAILGLLKKHIHYFQQRNIISNKEKENEQKFTEFFQRMLVNQDFYSNKTKQNFKINIPIVIQLCLYLYNLQLQLEMKIGPKYKLDKNNIQKIVNYHKFNPPYDIYDTIRKSLIQNNQNFSNQHHQKQSQFKSQVNKIKFNNSFNRYSALQSSFYTPSQILIQILFQFHKYFKYKLMDYQNSGMYNIWILKGYMGSKGGSIFLEDKKQNIIKKKQNRIIQKYIQNCLIFKFQQQNLGYLNNTKFDIRQWVLVKKFKNPLQVYVYQEFYIRICGQQYNILDLNNLSKHLTNYSKNKQFFTDKQKSVMHSSQFKKILKSKFNIEFQVEIQPQIQKIIKQVLSGYSSVIFENQNCFELYGFDFLLTASFQIYLLQVNLSPACEQRASWLTQMLNQMGKGLLQIVLPQNYLNMTQNYVYKWKRLQT